MLSRVSSRILPSAFSIDGFGTRRVRKTCLPSLFSVKKSGYLLNNFLRRTNRFPSLAVPQLLVRPKLGKTRSTLLNLVLPPRTELGENGGYVVSVLGAHYGWNDDII